MGRSVPAALVSWVRTASKMTPRRRTVAGSITALFVFGGWSCALFVPAPWAWIGAATGVFLAAGMSFDAHRRRDPVRFASCAWAASFTAATIGGLSILRSPTGHSWPGLVLGLVVLACVSLLGQLLTGFVIERRMGGTPPAATPVRIG